ncbi:MAG: AI-2E family transporter, partial [Betaproteobacteria bacterium]
MQPIRAAMCGDARPVASPVLAAAIKSLWRASDNCTPRAACDATPGNAQSGRGLISPRTLFIFRKPMATTPETPEPAEDVTPYAPAPTVAHISVLRRSNAIVVLALIAVVVFLHWAQAVLIPITLSVFLTYALKPIVNWLERNAKLPKAIGAAVTLVVILGAMGWGLNSLQSEALDVLDIVPRATEKFSIAIRGNPRQPEGAVEKMKKAAT